MTFGIPGDFPNKKTHDKVNLFSNVNSKPVANNQYADWFLNRSVNVNSVAWDLVVSAYVKNMPVWFESVCGMARTAWIMLVWDTILFSGLLWSLDSETRWCELIWKMTLSASSRARNQWSVNPKSYHNTILTSFKLLGRMEWMEWMIIIGRFCRLHEYCPIVIS